jgi:putative transposase
MSRRYHSELYYHFVWATLERAAVVSPHVEEALVEVIRAKCRELGLQPVEVNGTEDHLHVLLRGSSKVAPATIAQQLKGASSYGINELALCPAHFDWQGGYGVISVSPHDVETVARYIRNQKEHHAKNTTRVDLESISDTTDGGEHA